MSIKKGGSILYKKIKSESHVKLDARVNKKIGNFLMSYQNKEIEK